MVAAAENSGAAQRVCHHTVNRRYSEFLNLQTRLEEKPEVKKLIKSETSPFSKSSVHHIALILGCYGFISDVKGPKKMFPDLMFGNADNDKVEARKTQLDTFVQVCIHLMHYPSGLCAFLM